MAKTNAACVSSPADSAMDLQLRSYARQPIPSFQEQLHLGTLVRAWKDWQGELSGHDYLRVQRAGKRARDRLVAGNMRLAVAVAKKYVSQGRGLALSDLVQEGALGLVKAAERFDPTRGYTFSTYAFWWIRQAITRSIGETGSMIRVPLQTGDALWRARRDFQQANGPGSHLVLTGRLADAWRALSCSSTSVKMPDEQKTLEDMLPCPANGREQMEESLDGDLLRDRLERLLGLLPDLERQALLMRKVEELTLPAMAAQLQTSQGKAKGLVDRGMQRIKEMAAREDAGLPPLAPGEEAWADHAGTQLCLLGAIEPATAC